MLPIALLVALLYCLHLLFLCMHNARRTLVFTSAGAAIGAHLGLAAVILFQARGLHLGLLPSLSALFALTLASRYLLLRLSLPRLVDIALAAMALALVLLQGWLPNSPALAHSFSWLFRLHIIIAVAAYVAIALAALLASSLWIADRHLHRRPRSRLTQSLPPLLTLETRLFQILWTGFSLLTITLVSGVFFAEDLFGRPLMLTHKVIFSVLAWLVFAVLLGGRVLRGWRGRTAVTWTLVGFIFLVLAYAGSKFVLEVILQRPYL